jgi:hypothetical protein
MEVHMELSKKTTILFSPALHERLSKLAAERHVSLGNLVRIACERQYGLHSAQSRLAAVQRLAELDLPVADTRTMKEQSVPSPEHLCP